MRCASRCGDAARQNPTADRRRRELQITVLGLDDRVSVVGHGSFSSCFLLPSWKCPDYAAIVDPAPRSTNPARRAHFEGSCNRRNE
jgi:hypothetical protein